MPPSLHFHVASLRRRTSGPCAGFTLIELLTVIAIIGVLAAILIPVIGQARESSKSARCAANLRQDGIAIQAYVGDNKGVLPPGGAWLTPSYDADPRNFQTALAPYLSLTKTTNWGRKDVSKMTYSPTFDCPGYKGTNALDSRYAFQATQMDYDGITKIRPFGFVYQDTKTSQFVTSPKPLKQTLVPAKNEALTDRDFSTSEPNHAGYRNTLYFDWHVARVALNN